MHRGKIVEYIDQGDFVITICLQDDGGRLHLLTPSNREVNLSSKRAFLISDLALSPLSPREDLLSRLRQTEEKRTRLQQMVHVKELWELVEGEKEDLDHRDLAELAFGEKATDDHISGLVRALFHDRVYFRLKDGRFIPNLEDRVEQVLRQKEEDAVREALLREGGNWLREALAGRPATEPPCKERVIHCLVDLALHGEDAPNLKYGKELLARAGVSDITETRNLLVKLGIWEEDEDVDLLRLNITASFGEEELSESRMLAQADMDLQGREDLRGLPVITIDGPDTRDFDDALHIEIHEDTVCLGVHIADVAGLIPKESPLDREAFHRASSLYLPGKKIPMFPPNLSQDTLSLREGLDRPAISLLARFDRAGQLQEWRLTPSVIRVKRQLTYEGVNECHWEDGSFLEMYRLSQALRQKRVNDGALLLSLPDVSIQVGSDSLISIEMIDQNTPSRTLVAEFMILYNWLAATYCRDRGIPILYRGQQGLEERLSMVEADYPYFVFKQRSKLSPLLIDTKPAPHSGLGLDLYTNVSSPIRRYFDVMVQRQIRSALLNRSPEYGKEEMDKIRMGLEPTLKELERVKRGRTRYWLLKYLTHHTGESFSAVVLNIMKSKYRLLLTDFLLVAEMKRQNGEGIAEGQRIMVRVKKADPGNDSLRLEPVFN